MIFIFILLKTFHTCIGLSGRSKVPVIRAINDSIATVTYDKEAFNISRAVVEVQLLQKIPGERSKILGLAEKNIDQVRRKVHPFTTVNHCLLNPKK